jgi:RND family efflux transporter, MFP subunit
MAASIPLPKSKGRMKFPTKRWQRWLLGLLILALIGGGAAWFLLARRPVAPAFSTVQVTQGPIALVVSGAGSVQAARTSELSFQQSASVTEVAVVIGDEVKAGQVLAKMDVSALELAVKQAQANLESAQANLLQVQNGSATEQDIASATAQLNSAKAQLEETRSGGVTVADIANAQAALDAAQAKLDALLNPTAAQLSAAQITLTQAQKNLESQRDSLSQAKTSAYNAMMQAVEALKQAQTNYGTAKNNWDTVQSTGSDPNQTSTDGAKVDLSDSKRQEYYNSYIQAEASLRSAEIAVEQAQLNYDAARQNEATQIPLLEAQVANAQTQLEALQNPSESDIRQAKAAVTQAQANLTKLRQGGTAAQIAQSQASVIQAQANLESLTAPATEVELASARAQVTQAEVALAQAQTELEQATLRAPFDGVVAAVSVVEGGNSNAGTAAVTVIDISSYYIDVNLSETDAAQVKAGQNVDLSFDALPDDKLEGTVASVSPIANSESNVVTYKVRVNFVPGDLEIKVGMSSTAAIQVQTVEDALIVPSRAITTSGGSKSVMVMREGAGPQRVPVVTGLVSEGQTQIVSSGNDKVAALAVGDMLMVESIATGTSTNNRNTGGPGGPGGMMPGGMMGGPPGR